MRADFLDVRQGLVFARFSDLARLYDRRRRDLLLGVARAEAVGDEQSPLFLFAFRFEFFTPAPCVDAPVGEQRCAPLERRGEFLDFRAAFAQRPPFHALRLEFLAVHVIGRATGVTIATPDTGAVGKTPAAIQVIPPAGLRRRVDQPPADRRLQPVDLQLGSDRTGLPPGVGGGHLGNEISATTEPGTGSVDEFEFGTAMQPTRVLDTASGSDGAHSCQE